MRLPRYGYCHRNKVSDWGKWGEHPLPWVGYDAVEAQIVESFNSEAGAEAQAQALNGGTATAWRPS